MGTLRNRLEKLEARIGPQPPPNPGAERELTALLVRRIDLLGIGETLTSEEKQRMRDLTRALGPHSLPEAEQARRLATLRRRWGLAEEALCEP